jgi:hypothetical protein
MTPKDIVVSAEAYTHNPRLRQNLDRKHQDIKQDTQKHTEKRKMITIHV